jgi:1-deoxy-D-xylulose-5-phosphate synthase
VLRNLRDTEDEPGPDPAACRDAEGQGLRAGRASADKYHGVQKFNVVTGEQAEGPARPAAYQKVFAKA